MSKCLVAQYCASEQGIGVAAAFSFLLLSSYSSVRRDLFNGRPQGGVVIGCLSCIRALARSFVKFNSVIFDFLGIPI